MIQLSAPTFSKYYEVLGLTVAMFSFFCLLFVYMEMMGQLFGRENEMKIILISLGVITVLAVLFFVLSDKGVIPVLPVPEMPESTSGRITVGIVLNIVMFGISVIFGEITAGKLAKREL